MALLTKDAPLLIDMEEYHRLAVSLVDGNGYSGPSGPTAFRPPFYPVFLALVYSITGGPHVLAARLVQAMLGGAEVWLTYRVVLSLGLRGVALPAAWIVALYPSRILSATFLHREVLLGLLWLWQIKAFIALGSSPQKARNVVEAGLSVAAGALCNAVFLVTSLTLSVFALFLKISARRALHIGAAWLVALVLLVPWGYRNYREMGEWVWINTKGGRALWEGNNPGWMEGKTEMVIRQEQWEEMEGLSEVEADDYAKQQGLRFIENRPGEFLYLTWRRVLQFWRLELLPFFYYKQGYWGALPKVVLAAMGFLLLLPFPVLATAASAGGLSAWKKRSVKLFLLLFLVHCVASSLFIGGFRYHYPLIPGITVLAVLGWQRRSEIRRSKLMIWSVVSLLFALNFVDHVAANWEQVKALLGQGGKLEYSDTRSWMKKGLF